MSRAYRIAVSESLRRHVQVEDGVCSHLELLPVLAKERMGELLAQELLKKGFLRDGGAARRVGADGVEVSVELASGAVQARLSAKETLELAAQRTGAVALPELVQQGEDNLRAQARASLEKEAAAREEHLRQETTAKLERSLRDLREELDGVVNKVTVEALKQRAAELGEVQEVHEDPASGSLTIRVKV